MLYGEQMQPLVLGPSSRMGYARPALVVVRSRAGTTRGDARLRRAFTFLIGALNAERCAQIDPEEFFDSGPRAPAGAPCVLTRTREVVWPALSIYHARIPRAPRDLVLLEGTGASMRCNVRSSTPDRRAHRR